MIKIDHIGGFDDRTLQAAVRGMRNSWNSWDKSDSYWSSDGAGYILGDNDFALMMKLVKAGPEHSKFMRMLPVTMDITAPLYWWKEYDTYKIGTVANSCSTMHTLEKKEFVRSDFSMDMLTDPIAIEHMDSTIAILNVYRDLYINEPDVDQRQIWKQHLIQLLPTSYNQKRTVYLTFAVLRNIYHQRKDHRLYEWQEFCSKLCELPYSELIYKD